MWIAINELLSDDSNNYVVNIFTKPLRKEDLLNHLSNRFDLHLEKYVDRLNLIPISSYWLLDPSK